MLRFFLPTLALLAAAAPVFAADTSVGGYFRQDGTYVQPHHRSAPESTPLNNWSTQPNVNPYTGQPGTRTPESFTPGLYGNQTPSQSPQPFTQPRSRY